MVHEEIHSFIIRQLRSVIPDANDFQVYPICCWKFILKKAMRNQEEFLNFVKALRNFCKSRKLLSARISTSSKDKEFYTCYFEIDPNEFLRKDKEFYSHEYSNHA